MVVYFFFFFFFQAEDGIRDLTVTGVQTCALPISRVPTARVGLREEDRAADFSAIGSAGFLPPSAGSLDILLATRSLLVDRKSTRLNSSHSQISYAVFCLKKKIISDGQCSGVIHDC